MHVLLYSPFLLGAFWGLFLMTCRSSLLGFWDAEDRIVLGYISRPFGLSLLVLGNYSPRRGPWALMESGPRSQILWPHNNPSKSCCPDPRTERRVLMTSGLCQSLSIFVTYQFQRLFVCPRHVLGALEGETCLH